MKWEHLKIGDVLIRSDEFCEILEYRGESVMFTDGIGIVFKILDTDHEVFPPFSHRGFIGFTIEIVF